MKHRKHAPKRTSSSDTIPIPRAELARLLASQGAEEHPTIPAPPPSMEGGPEEAA
jgi:hypothetical protein